MKNVINQSCIALWVLAISISVSCSGQNNSNSNATDDESVSLLSPCTPDVGLSRGAKILFGCIQTNLTVEDRNAIFDIGQFHLFNDTLLCLQQDVEFLHGTEEDIHSQLYMEVFIYDLNKDGVDEILIQYSNAIYGGTAGNPSRLFTKEKSGRMKMVLDSFGLEGLQVKESTTLGWSDVVIGGAMTHISLYKWNGMYYSFSKKVE